MNKIMKRFLSFAIAIIVCLSTNSFAMAAEITSPDASVESVSLDDSLALTSSTRIGSCVFSLNNYADSSGNVLKSQGDQTVELSKKGPTTMTYIVLPQSNTGTVYLVFLNCGSSKSLTADGKAHTISISDMGLAQKDNIELRYEGATVPIVSISLVFYK